MWWSSHQSRAQQALPNQIPRSNHRPQSNPLSTPHPQVERVAGGEGNESLLEEVVLEQRAQRNSIKALHASMESLRAEQSSSLQILTAEIARLSSSFQAAGVVPMPKVVVSTL